MEDYFGLIVVAFFILAPILEKLLKGNRQPPPPPEQQQRRPRPVQPQPRPEYEQPHGTTSGADDDEEATAAEMLPDDLWAILTGQQPAPRRVPPPPPAPRQRLPAPAPRPEPVARRPAPVATKRDLPGRLSRELPRPHPRRPLPPPPMESPFDEEDAPRRTSSAEVFRYEEYVHEIPLHAPPVVVSMETPLEDAEARHTRFHDRVSHMEGAAIVDKPPAHRLAAGLRKPSDLRRAIILNEILSPPKGLE